MNPSTNLPSAGNVDPPTTAATTMVNLVMDVDGFVVNVPDGVASFIILFVTPAGTFPLPANVNAPPASARRVRDPGGAVMAVSKLLFPPTVFLMLVAAVMGRTTNSIPDPFDYSIATYVLVVAAVAEVVAAAVGALSAILPTPPNIEAANSTPTIGRGERFGLVASFLATIAVVLFVLGAGSLAFECTSLAIGGASDVGLFIK